MKSKSPCIYLFKIRCKGRKYRLSAVPPSFLSHFQDRLSFGVTCHTSGLTNSFSPAAPVGNSTEYLNLRELTAGGSLSLKENICLLLPYGNTIYAFFQITAFNCNQILSESQPPFSFTAPSPGCPSFSVSNNFANFLLTW